MTFDEFMNLSEGDRYRYFMTLDGAERDAHVNSLAERGLNIVGGQANSEADADNTDFTFGGESGRPVDYSGQLNELFNQLLGRDIRQAGLDYWSNDLSNGAKIGDVRHNIMRSQEYADYQSSQEPPPPPPPPPPPTITEPPGYDRVSDEQINDVYNDLFGRDAREAGLDYWGDWSEEYNPSGLSNAILSGANRDGVDYQWYFNNVLNEEPTSEEPTGYDRVSNGQINDVYNDLFGRDARETGLDYWGDWSEQYDPSGLRNAILAGANRDGIDYQWYFNNVLNDSQGEGWDDPYLGVGPNEPVTNPGQTPGESGGYNWNWEDFQSGAPDMEGGGGYDPNDYAFDRYVPGQESPWGVPDVEGGNKDFYRNQMLSLLRDEQNFRDRQRESDAIRQGADPLEATPMDWSWLEGGLPEVRVGGSADDWRQNEGYSGLNNLEALDRLRSGGDISKTTYDWFRSNWGEADNNASWLTGNTDYQGLSGMGQQPWERSAYQDVANGLYENFGDNPGVAHGYAAPVAGYNPTRNASGSASSYYYNPFTGGWQAPGVQGGGGGGVPGGNPGGVPGAVPGGKPGGVPGTGPGQDKK